MTWTPVPLPGIGTDSLGEYLCALGVLRAVTEHKEWKDARGFWCEGHFALQSQATTFNKESLGNWLLRDWKPLPFEKWWGKTQEASKMDSDAVAKARAFESDARVDELDVVMVQSRHRVFNDLLGTGGNIGKRNLPKLWKTCRELCCKPKAADWLDQTLFAADDVDLPELKSAGTWFVYSNKTFNSGQDWHREGLLSPWSFLLAMEGVRLLRGGVHRRHGTRITGKAVFPFMCRPAAPTTDGQIAHGKSEFWAPLWKKPATLIEIEAMFRSGLAEIGGRPASAPHEFAIAALGAGVDAGIGGFAPFEFRQTTSAQVFEAIPREHIGVERTARSDRCSRLLLPLIRSGWLDRLPREPSRADQRGRFVGLRGPVEAGILHMSERPDDPDAWQALLLLLARAQEKIDRNKTLRENCIPIPPLPEGWFDRAWPNPPRELRLARAIASIGWRAKPNAMSGAAGAPVVTNIFGLSPETKRFPKARPASAVWHSGQPLRALVDVLRRRLIDADELAAVPVQGARPCEMEDVARFLHGPGEVDDGLFAQWIPPLSLLNWKSAQWKAATPHSASHSASHPLYTLFRPLFDPDAVRIDHRPLFPSNDRDSRKPHAAAVRKLSNLLLQGEIGEAIELARRRYLHAGWRTFEPPQGELVIGADRLLAALLIPVGGGSLSLQFRRDWILASKDRTERNLYAHT